MTDTQRHELTQPGDLLTAAEIGRRLGVSPRSIWRWSAEGRLPQPIRLSARCSRWRAADIAAWIGDLETGPRPDVGRPDLN